MIDLIFNIFNLFVFIALIAYAYYTYLLPSLKLSFKNYELNLANLENKKVELITAQQDVEYKIGEQDKLCIILKGKVELWKQSLDNVLFHKKNSHALFKNKLYEKIRKQSENYQNEEVKKRVTPELINMLTKDLKQHFKKEENIDLYFSRIFKELK